ncbi:MAG: FtsX-like permease family protein [Alphaproteobacteria bacterium]
MITLVARTNLKLHFKTVSLLHLFGATDEYILRQFQWNGAFLAMRGALAGVLLAAVLFGTAVVLTHHWASPVLPPLDFGLRHVAVFIALPVFIALTALLATRLTVQSMLHHIH